MTTASQSPGEPTELNALVALAQREHRAGRLPEAAAAYRKVIALRPDAAEVHYNLGLLLCQQAQFDEALPRFEQALALKPNLLDAHLSLGRLFDERGDYQRAANHYESALALRPDAVTCNRLDLILGQQGKLDQAVARFEQAIALAPDDAEAFNNLGSVLSTQDKPDQAALRIRQALALRPNFSEAHNNLGTTLAQQNQFAEAEAHYRQAIAHQPNNAEAHFNLGSLLWQQDQLGEAAVHLGRALALRPKFPDAHIRLGYLLALQGKFDEAAVQFEQALALRPDDPDALDNLARLRLVHGKFDRAEAHFKQLLSVAPENAEAEYGLASCYLLQGDFRRGWPAYESRLQLLRLPPKPDLPRWNGEPLAGRRLILIAEQGLGDTLQFLRFARVLRSQGTHVTLAVQPRLVRLLASHPDLDQVIVARPQMEYPAADFYLYLLSLPLVLGTNLSNIPAEFPYLSPDPQLSSHWRQELSKIEGFKIGIVWQVTHEFPPYLVRSIPLAQFAPLARLPGVRLISLQKGAGLEQIDEVDFPVLDFGDQLDEAAGAFMDSAAIVANLDLVVTVDTSITHLAAALGTPVFLALHFFNEWRWQLDRDDSPWYPSVRLFRQQAPGQWSDVFERIAQAIQHRRSARA